MSRHRKQPAVEIPGLDVAKAKRYSRTRLGLFVVSVAWGAAQMLWLARKGRATRLRAAAGAVVPDRRLAGPVFFGATTVLSWLAGLPLGLVGGWLVERRFGLSKQPLRGWFADELKGLGVALALQPVLLSGTWAIIRRRPQDWWLVLSALTVPLTVLFGTLAPVVIMPLFNRFEPLKDAALAARIRALAERAGVRIADVYGVDMSRQTEKPNAFFAGLGKTKRIALGDTLTDAFSPAEVEGVVAHELGHQVHADIWKLIGFGGIAGFATAGLLAKLTPPVLARTAEETGVRDLGDEASYPVVALVLSLLGFVLAPLQAAFSRAIERQADAYALQLTGDGDAYASAMARLASLSLADPDPPKPVVWLLYSHPPVAERIRAARAFSADRSRGRSPAE